MKLKLDVTGVTSPHEGQFTKLKELSKSAIRTTKDDGLKQSEETR